MRLMLPLLLSVGHAQSCPTLSDPTDYTAHGILQARILEWVAVPSPGDLPNPGAFVSAEGATLSTQLPKYYISAFLR